MLPSQEFKSYLAKEMRIDVRNPRSDDFIAGVSHNAARQAIDRPGRRSNGGD
jgi:hypothetical protein